VGPRRWLIGKTGISTSITNAPRSIFGGTSGTRILGRVGYFVTLSASAIHL
jgi:hypothetical protein